MSWLSRLADRLVLQPSTHPVDSGELEREWIPTASGKLEAWVTRCNPSSTSRSVLLVKFPGTGGRAERSTPNPAHFWTEVQSEVWTINPFGYGGSSGPATLQRYPEMVEVVYQTLRERFPEHRMVVYGSSLGSISALAMARRFPVDGVYLRNPVPIHQLISNRPRYVWPSLGLSRHVARQIPQYLDAVANAGGATAPCLFVMSECDRLVPPQFQARIMDNYAGEKRIFGIPGADHQDSIPDELGEAYIGDVNWLGSQIFQD